MSRAMRRLYQQVAEQLRQRIRQGEYNVGDRMPAERLLAEEFDVSRPTVREAMIALEITGFVEVRVGSGVHVISRSGQGEVTDELDVGPFELMEARLLIESDIASVAAERIDEIQIRRLDELLDDMVRENEIGEVGEQADRDFHITIAQGTQNSALVGIAERFWALRETSPMMAEMLNRSRAYGIQPMISDHRLILEALRARDPQGAHKAMADHLTRVIDALLEVTETEAIERVRTEAEARRKRYIRRPRHG
ncbi:MAG: FadR/GntR family transcriptional regulator [Pseudomonadota bacterium]